MASSNDERRLSWHGRWHDQKDDWKGDSTRFDKSAFSDLGLQRSLNGKDGRSEEKIKGNVKYWEEETFE